MSRPRDPNRIHALADAASAVFLEKGYRQTQISDIAKAMRVAPGTVYLYVESKDALFELVVRRAMSPGRLAEAAVFPIRRSSESALLAFLRRTLEAELRFPALEPAAGHVSPAKARRELEAVVRELFRATSRNWLALKLLERSAADWPELASLWFGQHRPRVFLLLVRYLQRRMAARSLRPAPDAAVAARLVIEIVASMAMHCRADRYGPHMEPGVAEEVVVDMVVQAYGQVRTAPKRRGSK